MLRRVCKWLVVGAVLLGGAVACSNDKLQCKSNSDCASGYVCTYGACFKVNVTTSGGTTDTQNGQ